MRYCVILVTLWNVLAPVSAQRVSRGTAEATVAGKKITVEYGRPELRGRDMLGQAEPGMVWRMGADQATSISIQADLLFGQARMSQGRYSLFARKLDSDRWELIVNADPDVWGTRRDPDKDLMAIPLQAESRGAPVETFTITLKSTGGRSGELAMAWGTMALKTGFTVE